MYLNVQCTALHCSAYNRKDRGNATQNSYNGYKKFLSTKLLNRYKLNQLQSQILFIMIKGYSRTVIIFNLINRNNL